MHARFIDKDGRETFHGFSADEIPGADIIEAKFPGATDIEIVGEQPAVIEVVVADETAPDDEVA